MKAALEKAINTPHDAGIWSSPERRTSVMLKNAKIYGLLNSDETVPVAAA
jgi:hypothetical protein